MSVWLVFLAGVEIEEAGPLGWWSLERLGWVLAAVLWRTSSRTVEEDDDGEKVVSVFVRLAVDSAIRSGLTCEDQGVRI
nr:hypothetical protein CFP56_48667 [Quercus suber]